MREGGISSLLSFGKVFDPREADEPILTRPVREALMEWITEIWAKDELQVIGVTPRRKAIFDGPPGVGKTTLAHHLAARLGYRMLAVRPERIIDCWVGASSRNLGELFSAIAAEVEPVILFFDEFDAIAGKRRSSKQAADDHYNELVATLLQCIDRHEGMIIAATNFGKDIDPAVWRRFDIHIGLTVPGQDERERILKRYLKPFVISQKALDELALSFETASPALMRQFCESLKRAMVIGPKVKWNMQREAVIERIISSVQPHPDLGKPRLWNVGAKDAAVKLLHWPLVTTVQDEPLPAEVPFGAETGGKVINLREVRP